ncbi:hypothetical protein BCR34DRAFT_575943 [Clohesyomyces aquaticus]|uniref:Uncharacterized protein n=1 Tax=Clohesyomyces aquaticus TaxID=1231657 RepID=A0A1Y1YR84_9PLEO|nr:hypothetical protein BCR34DRAFT_575943 [Clohesyomyces aquaticus]
MLVVTSLPTLLTTDQDPLRQCSRDIQAELDPSARRRFSWNLDSRCGGSGAAVGSGVSGISSWASWKTSSRSSRSYSVGTRSRILAPTLPYSSVCNLLYRTTQSPCSDQLPQTEQTSQWTRLVLAPVRAPTACGLLRVAPNLPGRTALAPLAFSRSSSP